VQRVLFVELDIKAGNCPNPSVKPAQPSAQLLGEISPLYCIEL
jgi:hypothetical protein